MLPKGFYNIAKNLAAIQQYYLSLKIASLYEKSTQKNPKHTLFCIARAPNCIACMGRSQVSVCKVYPAFSCSAEMQRAALCCCSHSPAAALNFKGRQGCLQAHTKLLPRRNWVFYCCHLFKNIFGIKMHWLIIKLLVRMTRMCFDRFVF